MLPNIVYTQASAVRKYEARLRGSADVNPAGRPAVHGAQQAARWWRHGAFPEFRGGCPALLKARRTLLFSGEQGWSARARSLTGCEARQIAVAAHRFSQSHGPPPGLPAAAAAAPPERRRRRGRGRAAGALPVGGACEIGTSQGFQVRC